MYKLRCILSENSMLDVNYKEIMTELAEVLSTDDYYTEYCLIRDDNSRWIEKNDGEKYIIEISLNEDEYNRVSINELLMKKFQLIR